VKKGDSVRWGENYRRRRRARADEEEKEGELGTHTISKAVKGRWMVAKEALIREYSKEKSKEGGGRELYRILGNTRETGRSSIGVRKKDL